MLLLTTRKQEISRLIFSPGGDALAAAGKPGAYIWELSDPAAPRHLDAAPTFPSLDGCWGLDFDFAGRILIVALNPRGVILYDRVAGAEILLPRCPPWGQIACCPTSSMFVWHSTARGSLSGWRLEGTTATRLWTMNARSGSHGVVPAFGPDGTWFVTFRFDFEWKINSRTGEVSRPPPRFVVRATATGHVLRTITPPSFPGTSPVVAPDGGFAVYATSHNLVLASATGSNDPPRVIPGTNRKAITAVAFHPSGRYLAATSNDATVKLYDTATWAVAKTFTWGIGKLRSVAFSPDGTRAAVGSDTGKVLIWDVDV